MQGAGDDDEMLLVLQQGEDDVPVAGSFFNFEARKVAEIGDVLAQLKVNAPPMLAVIKGDGTVSQLYTGWIGQKVMEQVVANALRAQ